MKDDKQESPEAALARQLENWWLERVEDEIRRTIPKAIEYSSVDLTEYGRTLALVLGRGDVSEEEATEIGIWGYMVGKIARWTGAIKEGRRPSDDTLFDVGVYIKMAQRNRDVGGWPHGSD